jgi:dipeptidyl aminopeptidase/acylaminoacyl peptidase
VRHPVRILIALVASGLASCSQGPGDPGVAGAPSDGLVFVRLLGGAKDLARARLSDGAVVSLRSTPDRDEDWPYWSQAAGRLLLQVKPVGPEAFSDLVLWDPVTRTERPLAARADRDEQWPMWSPNGREVVFAFRGVSPQSGIGVVDVASGVVRLAGTGGFQRFFFRPHFAPDGIQIVAQRRRGDSQGSDLWLLQADRPPRSLLDDPAVFYQKPWYTRDGREIVYTMRPTSGGPRDVYAIDAEGHGEPRQLVGAPDADDHSAIPSPTRDEIAFVSNRDGSMDIFLADLAGGAPRNLTRTADIDEYAPHWSPDGERLVVSAGPAQGRLPGTGDDIELETARIVVLQRDGQRLFETAGFMADWMPAWP